MIINHECNVFSSWTMTNTYKNAVYLERTIINPTQGDKATASSTFLTPRIQWVTPPRKSDSLFCEYCALSAGVIWINLSLSSLFISQTLRARLILDWWEVAYASEGCRVYGVQSLLSSNTRNQFSFTKLLLLKRVVIKLYIRGIRNFELFLCKCR